MIEEGPLKSSTDFRMREADAYRDLYQESAARKTADKAINILQGRCVGGGTTVNWTSSFRTPAATLAHWQSTHGWSRDGADAIARRGSIAWRRASASRRGRSPRTPTTRRSRAAPQRSASTTTSSAATSRAAGTSATAGWDARPTRSSRCWSRRSRTRSMAARRSSRARARTDTSSAATTSTASNAWRWTRQERRRRHAGSPCAHARS